MLRGRDAIDPNLWVVVAAHTDLQTSFPALLVAAVMMESDVPLWVSAAMAALESGQGAPVLNAIVDAALFQTDNAFYDALSYWSSLPVNESETPDEEAAAEGTDDGDQAVPDGAPALKIDVRDVRSHAQILLDLAGDVGAAGQLRRPVGITAARRGVTGPAGAWREVGTRLSLRSRRPHRTGIRLGSRALRCRPCLQIDAEAALPRHLPLVRVPGLTSPYSVDKLRLQCSIVAATPGIASLVLRAIPGPSTPLRPPLVHSSCR